MGRLWRCSDQPVLLGGVSCYQMEVETAHKLTLRRPERGGDKTKKWTEDERRQ